MLWFNHQVCGDKLFVVIGYLNWCNSKSTMVFGVCEKVSWIGWFKVHYKFDVYVRRL